MAAEVSKITESARRDLSFIFIGLSEKANSFVKLFLFLSIIIVVSFIKLRFYWNRGFKKLHKYAEIFHVNKGYKLAMSFLYRLCPESGF